MAPNKWDEESEEDSTPPTSPPPVARRKFDDEESEDEVLDDWEAADDSETEREKAKKAEEDKAKADAAAKANHKSKAQRVASHIADRERQRQEEEDASSEDEETEAERRARLRRTEKDSDLAHAEDLFGDLQVTNRRTNKAVTLSDPNDAGNTIDLSSLPIFNPTTKDQFAKLRETLTPLLAANSKKAHYTMFMQDFAKAICKDLPSDQIKKIASGLTTLSNEKMKEEKQADKGGKKTKAQKTKTTLHADRGIGAKTYADTHAYNGDDGMDDDDFM